MPATFTLHATVCIGIGNGVKIKTKTITNKEWEQVKESEREKAKDRLVFGSVDSTIIDTLTAYWNLA